jgi:hypothetical protein
MVLISATDEQAIFMCGGDEQTQFLCSNDYLSQYPANITTTTTTPPAGGGGGGTEDQDEVIVIIGVSEEEPTTINLNSLEIISNRVCNEDGRLEFITLDTDENLTLIDFAKLEIDNITYGFPLYLDLNESIYYYIVNTNETGLMTINITVNQNGKSISESKEITIADCFDFDEYTKTVWGRLKEFIKENLIYVAIILVIIASLTIILIYSRKK